MGILGKKIIIGATVFGLVALILLMITYGNCS
jgi:hypothetical protein